MRSAHVRSALLRGILRGQRIRAWLFSEWRRLVLLYVAAAALVSLHSLITSPAPQALWLAFRRHPAAETFAFLRWFFAGKLGPWVVAIALAALLYAIAAAWRARHRIVISDFADLTGDNALKDVADRLSRRLMLELGAIEQVYTLVSDDPADLSLDQHRSTAPELAVDAAIQGFSELQASVKGEKIQLGPISLPLDAAMNTLSTLVRGPRIAGSLQKNSDGLLLEASITGERTQSWRVSQSDIELDPDGDKSDLTIADALIRQMAQRIFADMWREQLGTRAWRAVGHYSEGLRQFHKGQKEEGDKRTAYLERAQSEFFLAYREDRSFLRSQYNLGVIYHSQKQYTAAYNAFEATIRSASSEPLLTNTRGAAQRLHIDMANVHYAAAKAAQGCSNWERVAYHCDLALSLDPLNGAAWNLKGVIHPYYGTTEPAVCFQEAVTSSWLQLCRSAWQGSISGSTARKAAVHVANLAKSHIAQSRSITEMKQALFVNPADPDNWFDLGRLSLARKSVPEALEAFQAANREKEKALYWTWIACCQQLLEAKEPAAAAWRRAKEVVFGDIQQLPQLTRFLDDIAHPQKAIEQLKWIPAADFEGWKTEAKELDDFVAKLKKIKSDVESGTATYPGAIRAVLGQPDSDTSLPQNDEAALDWLRQHYDESFWIRELSESVLQSAFQTWPQQTELDLSRLDLTQKLVAKALANAPLGAVQRSRLATIYFLLRMTDLATDEVINALSLEPTNNEVTSLSIIQAWTNIQLVPDKKEQRKWLLQLDEIYGWLANAYSGNIWEMSRENAGMAHHWHGRVNTELLRFRAAQKGLETSFACRYKPIESLQNLCYVHFRAGAFEDAEKCHVRLRLLLRIDGDSRPLQRQDLLQVTDEYRKLEEEYPPAFHLALAAFHTAAAMAEQRLVVDAAQRLREGRKWARSLAQLPPDQAEMLRSVAAAAFLLCQGAVRLAAGQIAAPVRPKTSSIADSAEKDGDLGSHRVSPRIRHLEQAIDSFTQVIQLAVDRGARADAQFRIAVACEALSGLDSANAASWKSNGFDALRCAEAADRRDEYKERIPALRTALEAKAAQA